HQRIQQTAELFLCRLKNTKEDVNLTENKKTLSETAEKYLRERIINGKLLPNEKIVESDIAKQLNISRGPVREALRTLMLEGLIEYEPNKGCTVTTLSAKDAYEVFFMRGSLEKIALEKCGGKLSDASIFKLEVALNEMKSACESNDTFNMVAADEMFHQQIVDESRMDRLVKMWKMLSPLNGAMFLTVQNAKRIGKDIYFEDLQGELFSSGMTIYEAHKEMYDILKKGNLEESCKSVDDHYIVTGERIYRVFLREESKENFGR
ncbi:MAG: GntR family transcriptional regulator, partial [Oscillospiraceae bacterium]